MPFWAFIYLAASWLAASADRGLVMRPAEIHFLFGGPFRSREIISLHLIRLGIRSFFSAMVLSLVAAIYMPSFTSGLIGLWLLLAVSLLVGMNVSLMARSIHGTAPRIVRRLLTIVVVISTLTMIAQSVDLLRQQGMTADISSIAATAPETGVGQYVLPALQWMFKPLSTTSFLDECLPLLPIRLVVVSILVLTIYLLGGGFSETSATRTDQAVARRQAALRSGSAAGTSSLARRVPVPLPSLRLGGIVAVAWSQVVHLTRILPRYMAFTTVVLGLLIVLPAMVDRQSMSGKAGIYWLSGLSLYADFLLLLQLPVGFMGPASQRELLKTLPIPNWRIVIGQLVGPCVPIVLIHSITGVLFALVFPVPWPYLICTVVALIPAAGVIVSNINLLGIWGIIQPRALQQRDVLAAGRAMVSVWLFAILLIPASFVATLTGMLLEWLAVSFLPENCGFILGCGLGCLFSACINVALIAWTFAGWQPSTAERGDAEKEHDH
ncbi:MAG: putative ABC exporter domain-containing protein [Pirellulales bacterium]